jgi:flagellar basal body L-ring protein FlgH
MAKSIPVTPGHYNSGPVVRPVKRGPSPDPAPGSIKYNAGPSPDAAPTRRPGAPARADLKATRAMLALRAVRRNAAGKGGIKTQNRLEAGLAAGIITRGPNGSYVMKGQ